MGRILEMDIETFSDVDLIKCGVYAYADSPAFEVLLFAYSFDGGETRVIDLAQGEELPGEVAEAVFDGSVVKTAFNANFERTCLSKYFGRYLPPESWHCSAVQAAVLALPRSLEDVGAVLGLDERKMKEGKELIRYFCVPCKPTKANGGRRRNLPCHAPEKWELFKAYCMRDVDVEKAIRGKLCKFPIPEGEMELYRLDQRINDRGVLVDMGLGEAARRTALKMGRTQSRTARARVTGGTSTHTARAGAAAEHSRAAVSRNPAARCSPLFFINKPSFCGNKNAPSPTGLRAIIRPRYHLNFPRGGRSAFCNGKTRLPLLKAFRGGARKPPSPGWTGGLHRPPPL